MKIRDRRCGRVLEGTLVEQIPGHRTMSDEQLEKYLGVCPGDKQYNYLKRGSEHAQYVLQHEKGFLVIPMNSKFYEVVPETQNVDQVDQ